MKLAHLRSAEAGFEGADAPLAIVPIGAVEQHSAHLPLGTDALIVDLIASSVEERRRDEVLLLPTMHVGASDHHLAMPGTVSIGTQAVADLVARQCLSLAHSSGVRRFLILNGHGGNQPAARLALESMHAADPSVDGFAVDYWSLMFDELDAAGVEHPPAMGHADLIETSILLSRMPALVRMDLSAVDGYADGLPVSVATTLGIPERTRGGGVGDPRGATAALGKVFLDAAVDGVCDLIDRIGAMSRAGR
jgi:creatinine amidohydrolase